MHKDSCYKSERLRYKGIEVQDAEDIVAWRSDPENFMNFFDARSITLEDHLKWFDRYLNDETRYDFMIFDENDNPIGTVGLSNITADSCEISYMIGDRSSRGKGFATEAVNALTNIAFDELEVSEVIARVLSHNEVSAKVVLGAGYEDTEHIFKVNRSAVSPDIVLSNL